MGIEYPAIRILFAIGVSFLFLVSMIMDRWKQDFLSSACRRQANKTRLPESLRQGSQENEHDRQDHEERVEVIGPTLPFIVLSLDNSIRHVPKCFVWVQVFEHSCLTRCDR
jgi:hypothetical protein